MTWPSSPPPGWYPDPENPANLRWWDGTRWSEYRTPVWSPPLAQGMAPAVPVWQPPMGAGVGVAAAPPAADLSVLLPPNRDAFAFASECLGLLSLLPNPVTSIAAIVCGFLGLHRMKSSTQLGRGRAWFGIIAGAVSAMLFLLIAVAVHDGTSADAQRAPAQSSYIVRPGPDDGQVATPTFNPDSVAQCRHAFDAVAAPPAVRAGDDFIRLIRSLNTPALPLPGYERDQPDLPLGRYPDVESYVRADKAVGVDVSSRLLEDDGYVVAEGEVFNHAGNLYAAEGIQFRNSTAADHYNRMAVLDLCQDSLASNIRPIGGIDGVSFVRADVDMSIRASLVIGSTVIHLNICSCFVGRGLQSLVELWARRVEQQTAASASSRIADPIPPATHGADTSATIARQNLVLAEGIVRQAMRAHPNRAITEGDLNASGSGFMWDIPSAPIGDPGTLGTAVVSTYISRTSPQHVLLALPGGGDCYFVEVSADGFDKYGVDSGAGASRCFVGEVRYGTLQMRPEVKWYDTWPAG